MTGGELDEKHRYIRDMRTRTEFC